MKLQKDKKAARPRLRARPLSPLPLRFFSGRKKSVFNSQWGFKALKYFSYVCAGLAVAALVFILCFILIQGVPHLTPRFLFGEYDTKDPTIGTAFAGTFYLVGIAMTIAAPIGICSAVFLSEYAGKGKLVNAIRVATETLAAIPSVVYGLFGAALFVYAFKWGYTLLGGGIAVSLMILPTIIRAAEEAMLAVPLSYREASYALGASKVRTIFTVVLPSAASGIVTSLILAVGRVISESAVFLLTIGMLFTRMPAGPMDWGSNLALFVYYHGSYGYPEQAAAGGVVLIALVLGINLLATFLGRLLSKGKR